MAVFFLFFPVKVSNVTLGKNHCWIRAAGLHVSPFVSGFFFYGNKIIDAGLGHSVCMQKKAGTQHL